VKKDLPTPATLTAERIERFTDDADVNAIAEAAAAAILVPERELIVGRMDGIIYGAAMLLLPSRNNEAQSFAATILQNFVAPYARGHGLARLILQKTEERARALNYYILNLDVRETQTAAIALYEAAGFVRWGTHPAYARVKGTVIQGHYYCKRLTK
jgi:ribosomal protein S18 acetylase RimI-like enzyme